MFSFAADSIVDAAKSSRISRDFSINYFESNASQFEDYSLNVLVKDSLLSVTKAIELRYETHYNPTVRWKELNANLTRIFSTLERENSRQIDVKNKGDG